MEVPESRMDVSKPVRQSKSGKRKETLRLIWLEALVALQDERKIHLAAKRLAINPRTLDRYLDELQDWLGFTLLEKRNPGDRTPVEFHHRGLDFCNKARIVIEMLYDSRKTPSFEQVLGMIAAKDGAQDMHVVVRSVAGKTWYEID